MSLTLAQVLTLVGKLDDSPGADTARERFRSFLVQNVSEVGQVRDFIEVCLRTPGEQYSRALQDLVNHLGHLLGFQVTFGRYQGVPNQIGFDGHWQSQDGFHLVIEVKTSDVYSVRAATLVGYVDRLISEKQVPDWDHSLGLYVIGRIDPGIHQLENAIVAEKRTNQLRIISADALLSLAEIMNEYDVTHQDVLTVIRPSGPMIDSTVGLMTRLVGGHKSAEETETPETNDAQVEVDKEGDTSPEPKGTVAYWLSPVKSDEHESAEETVRRLVGEEMIYAFGNKTPGRSRIKRDDMMCFYATSKGVVAHATVASEPTHRIHPKINQPEKYPWVFELQIPRLYLDDPIVIDADLRKQLDAFESRDPMQHWAWFVQFTKQVTRHDFELLTRSRSSGSIR